MAETDIHRDITCSKCGLTKSATEFGTTGTKNGVRIKRAQCRSCYNEHRRAHYSRPEVHAEKQKKRKIYQERPEVREARNRLRRTPQHRAREKIARDRYRSNEIKAAQILAQRARRLASLEGKSVALLGASLARARKNNFSFDLDIDWVRDRLKPGICELTGLPFSFDKAPNGWRYNPMAPSIDQIRAGAGYTKSNSRLVIVAINNAISQYGEDYFEVIAAAFLKRRGFTVER